MSTAICADCIKGSLDEGTPKGEDITLAGVQCYICKPATPNGCAVILATDVFGYQLVNARLIADVFASNGYLCVVPDYFKGEPVSSQLFEAEEAWEAKSVLGKIAAAPQRLWIFMGLLLWIRRHPLLHAVDVVTAVAAELRQQHGVNKIGLQGYCYGGSVGVLMAAKAEVMDAVSIAHPGPVKVPADIEAVQVPLLFTCAEQDQWFPEQVRTAALQCMEEKQPGLGTFWLYPGTKHGFAVRGDRRNPGVNAAREAALQRALQFFNQHLAGITPPQTHLDAAAPPIVGIRLMLAPRTC